MADYVHLSTSSNLADRKMLYLGDDHLMHVGVRGVSERYKRLPFAEIEAIVMRRTSSYLMWAILLGLLLLGGIAVQVSVMLTSPEPLLAIVTVLPWAVILGVHLALGPTCRVSIQTAVQQLELPITRVAKARKVIARVRQQIEQAQGRWDAELLGDYRAREVEAPELEPGDLRPHRILYSLLGLEAVLLLASIFLASPLTVTLIVLLNGAIVVVALWAVKDGLKGISAALRWLIGIAFVVKTFGLTIILTIPSFDYQPDSIFADTNRMAFTFYANQQPMDSLVVLVAYLIAAMLWSSLAIGGTLGIYAEQSRRDKADSAESATSTNPPPLNEAR